MNDLMNTLTFSPYFGVVLSIFAFEMGTFLSHKIKSSLANPMLIAILLIAFVLQVCHIPLAAYNKGGDLITLFLAPATAALAVPIYKNLQILRAHLWPILIGTLTGSFCSMGMILILGKLLGFDRQLIASLIAKSVTTPIAMEVTVQLGGVVPIIIAAVVFTGTLGAIIAPSLVKIFKVDNPIAQGIAIGTCSHAVGTTRAIAMGDIQGAMSGIAIGLAGLFTVLLTFVFAPLL